jgi:hypothetical protein
MTTELVLQSDKEAKVLRNEAQQRHHAHADELLDEALRESFPASDPIAVDVPESRRDRPKTSSQLTPAKRKR